MAGLGATASKMNASRHCRFIGGNRPWRRSTRCCKCLTPSEAERRELRQNLNPNRRYRPPWTQTTRISACDEPAPPNAPQRQRQRRERPPCSPMAYVGLKRACEFADVLYRAWQHTYYRSDVQADLSRGRRYSLTQNHEFVILEAPETTYCFRTRASHADVLAELPGACRASSRREQRAVRACIAEWWLGADEARRALLEVDEKEANDVPLQPGACDSALPKCRALDGSCQKQQGCAVLAPPPSAENPHEYRWPWQKRRKPRVTFSSETRPAAVEIAAATPTVRTGLRTDTARRNS